MAPTRLIIDTDPGVDDAVAIMLALATLEATVLAGALPSAQSLLTEGIADDAHGRVQGLNATSQMAAMTVASMLGGVLFAISPSLPFVASASISLVGAGVMAVVWRPVNGHVGHSVSAS